MELLLPIDDTDCFGACRLLFAGFTGVGLARTTDGEDGVDPVTCILYDAKVLFAKPSPASVSSWSNIDMLLGTTGKMDEAVLERLRAVCSLGARLELPSKRPIRGDERSEDNGVGWRIVNNDESNSASDLSNALVLSPSTYDCIRECLRCTGSVDPGLDVFPSIDR